MHKLTRQPQPNRTSLPKPTSLHLRTRHETDLPPCHEENNSPNPSLFFPFPLSKLAPVQIEYLTRSLAPFSHTHARSLIRPSNIAIPHTHHPNNTSPFSNRCQLRRHHRFPLPVPPSHDLQFLTRPPWHARPASPSPQICKARSRKNPFGCPDLAPRVRARKIGTGRRSVVRGG
ncbi:hypothetical protein EJ04DRAFT_512407 [Polyplosphaeria fusca]|uniref:Uncharacterized protein n=1 Tax=Polyplosphaeria fusca TaxID=682080 RepID=A0A9P4R0L7_9PLEO|nr:hypothetical protein EJ04DRAFT_512407 [Polyplosphaeria fusca]